MPKVPIKIGNETLEVQEFSDGEERVVKIDDRFYNLWAIPNSDKFYTMVRIGGHQRSVQGNHDKILEVLARIHKSYQAYESRCRNSKEAAQRDRDRVMNELAESIK
jgi:hypothetical protein